MIILKI